MVRSLADDHAALGGLLELAGVAVGGDQGQLVDLRRHGSEVVPVAVEGPGVEAAFHDPAGDELRDGRGPAREDGSQRVEPDCERGGMTSAESMLRGRADVEHRLPVEPRRVAGADRQDPARPDLAGCRQGRREPLGPLRRSSSPSGPSNVGSPRIGTTRASAGTSQG